jgi:GT2 family glycosyltransferase
MPRRPLVSLIVVSHNRRELLKTCLESLFKQDYGPIEIIAVDNGSSDGTAAYLKSLGKRVKAIWLNENLGFTGGNGLGYRLAKGAFIGLINNDARLHPDWVRRMVAAMKQDPQVGSCASRILSERNPLVLDSAGLQLISSSRGYERGKGEPADSRSCQEYIFGISGAAALLRRAMIEDVGFLDESMFFNCEDFDLSFRAQLRGWKCLFVPGAVAVHEGMASHRFLKSRLMFYWARNCEIVWLKNTPTGFLLAHLHHKVAQEFLTLCRTALSRRQFFAYVAGKLAVLPLLPEILRARHSIQSQRKVGYRYLKSLTVPLFSPGLLKAKAAGLLRPASLTGK